MKKSIFLAVIISLMFVLWISCSNGSVIHYTTNDEESLELSYKDAFDATVLLNTYRNGQGSIFFLGNLTSIGEKAFYSCTSLTSITIPDSVTSIGSGAFSGCTSLTSITIPDSVTSIGECAFWICTSLTSVTIPDSITSIGECAFEGCHSLTSVTIPDSVTSIGCGVFSGCTSLTSITIPDSVTSIGDWAFSGCTSLTSVTIPNSVTLIGKEVFAKCSSLSRVHFGCGLHNIGGSNIFEGCKQLSSVYIPYGVTLWKCQRCGKSYSIVDCIYHENLNYRSNDNECAECVLADDIERERAWWQERIKVARNKWVDTNPIEAQMRGIERF